MDKSDEALLEAYRRTGNRQLLGLLFKRHLPKVLGSCLYYLKDEADSEDAAMDIFEIVLQKAGEHQIRQFSPWLYQVCRNHCFRVLRERLQIQRVELQEIDGAFFVEFDESDALHDREAKFDLLSESIEKLKSGQRECIIYFFLKGMTYKEIERATSFSLNEVKSHIQNGKRNLKNALTNASGPAV